MIRYVYIVGTVNFLPIALALPISHHLLFSLMKKVTKKSSRRSAGKMKSVTALVQGRALVGLTDLKALPSFCNIDFIS